MLLHTLCPLCCDLINTLQFSERYFSHKEGIHFCPRDRKVRRCSIIDDLLGQALSYLSPPDLSLAIIHHKLKLYSGGAAPAPLSAQPFVQRSSCLLHLEPLEGAGFKTCSSAPLLFGADGHHRMHLSNSDPLTSGPSTIFFSYLLFLYQSSIVCSNLCILSFQSPVWDGVFFFCLVHQQRITGL